MYNMAIIVENQARKWGNSFGIIIPAEIARKINLKEGQTVEIEIRLKRRIDAFGKFNKAKQFKEEKEAHGDFW